jgi:hypothetical protein
LRSAYNQGILATTFNLLRSGRPRMRLLIASLLVVLSGFGNSAVGQQAGNRVAPSDKTDINAYRTLFRQANLYKRLADEADKSPQPKPQLRRILATRYGFSAADGATLQRLALSYQAEITPIHQQVIAAIRKFQARFPSGTIPHGADTSPPPELGSLQNQEDSVTLRYRDLLRTSMREEDYQKIHTKILTSFGTPSAH